MKACASFGFASGALEQTRFGVPACFVVLVSFSSGNNARIWMTMQEDFLACSLSDAVRECLWPACLRKRVRCDGIASSVSPQCLDRLWIQILRQSTETMEGAKGPLQPAVMCSMSGSPEEPASLDSTQTEVSSLLTPNAKRRRFFRTLDQNLSSGSVLVVPMTCHVLQFLFAGPDVVWLASLLAVSLMSGEAAHS